MKKSARGRLPSDREVGRGVCYFFSIGNEIDYGGEVFQLLFDKPFCRFGTVPKRSPHSALNLAGKPTVVFRNSEDEELVRVVRRRRFPATFDLLAGDLMVGMVTRITPLRNRYRIELDAGKEWNEVRLTFHMPLFTIYFAGWSDCGKQVWVKVWRSKRQWLVMREPELNHPYLLPALAFIHREWWCYS